MRHMFGYSCSNNMLAKASSALIGYTNDNPRQESYKNSYFKVVAYLLCSGEQNRNITIQLFQPFGSLYH